MFKTSKLVLASLGLVAANDLAEIVINPFSIDTNVQSKF